MCSFCGSAFIPKRRPTAGRRRYCNAGAEGGASARDATRAHAERRAESYRLHVNLASAVETAGHVRQARWCFEAGLRISAIVNTQIAPS